MNALTLDTNDKRFASLAECEDGEEKTVTVTGTVTKGEDGMLTLDVSSIGYEAEEEESEEEGYEKPMKKGKMPSGPDHPAVMVLVAKKPGK